MNDRYVVRVEKMEQVTPTIKAFTLSSNTATLEQFGAGAHLTLHLPMGNRQYSLINNPLDMKNEYKIAVKNLGSEQGGSRYLHEQLEVGDIIEVSGPDNYFPVHLEAQHYLFFAAGIGITPFLSMMSYLSTLGKTFELHYAAPHVENCPFHEEITNKYSKQAYVYLGSREEKRKKLKEALRNRKVGTHVYMCGPKSFMEMLNDSTKELHFPQRVVHEERFRPALVIRDPKPFCVSVNGKDLVFVKENESLLERLRNEGYSIPYACRMGICGSCEVTLCEGEVLHSDSFLTEQEKKSKMLSCVSRGVGDIAIDVEQDGSEK
ncbi:PDR/VanB family oxidoreductase [Guptibacillus algicola]|uniref:PDR/VanB family oxidoreductase n=1 Tax=Guptibacillus algicola TaxID=225844 RepID=UPI001CD7B853|nr:PDR/VanB family oxidoreductase [Alkalihalobacillus algicola]MCA0988587.1 PDR/VanB family oxidoreductase [Alkalihalobacillus algicola]